MKLIKEYETRIKKASLSITFKRMSKRRKRFTILLSTLSQQTPRLLLSRLTFILASSILSKQTNITITLKDSIQQSFSSIILRKSMIVILRKISTSKLANQSSSFNILKDSIIMIFRQSLLYYLDK